MQRRVIPRQPGRFAHRKPSRCYPLFAVHRGERAGGGPMPRQTRRDGDKSLLLVALRQIVHAVGRIRQAVQQHRRAARFALRQQNKGAVPVGMKLIRIDQALRVKAVNGRFFIIAQRVGNAAFHIAENRSFPRLVFGKSGAVNLAGAHFIRRPGMPAVQRRTALRFVNTANKKDDHDHQQPNDGFFRHRD